MADAFMAKAAQRRLSVHLASLLVGVTGALFASGAAAQGAAAQYVPITGIFTETSPECGTGAVVCSGIGTGKVSWGTPVAGTVLQSSLTFTPNPTLDPIDILPGRVITLGTFTLVNGTAELDSWIDNATLRIDTGTYTPPLTFVVNTINTLCLGGEDPEVCADFIHFRESEVMGSFRVWEGYYGTVEVKGLVGSLSLAGFGKVVGVGFADVATGTLGQPIDPALLPPELQVAFLSQSTQPIPEPATVLQLLLGMGLLTAVLRGRRPGTALRNTVA